MLIIIYYHNSIYKAYSKSLFQGWNNLFQCKILLRAKLTWFFPFILFQNWTCNKTICTIMLWNIKSLKMIWLLLRVLDGHGHFRLYHFSRKDHLSKKLRMNWWLFCWPPILFKWQENHVTWWKSCTPGC